MRVAYTVDGSTTGAATSWLERPPCSRWCDSLAVDGAIPALSHTKDKVYFSLLPSLAYSKKKKGQLEEKVYHPL